jgi:hypothetical protein
VRCACRRGNKALKVVARPDYFSLSKQTISSMSMIMKVGE